MGKKIAKRRADSDSESMDEVDQLRVQALKTLKSKTDSGGSRSQSPKKKSTKVSKELDEERKRMENQVKASLQRLNKSTTDTMELLQSLDTTTKKKKKSRKEDSDDSDSEREKRKKSKKSKKKKSKKKKKKDSS